MTDRFVKPAANRRSPYLHRFALLAAASWILNGGALPARGQDLDVVLYAGDPAKPTMIDKIENAQERDAFVALKAVQDPASKRKLAEEFLREYPESWLTSFAHAMAAKACVALDDLQAGLDHGKRSLEILPENGSLLVTLANVQVHGGLLDEAEVSATDALEHLRRFRHASIYSKQEWARIRAELQGSAHYVLGRVAATRGLRATGHGREDATGARASLAPLRDRLEPCRRHRHTAARHCRIRARQQGRCPFESCQGGASPGSGPVQGAGQAARDSPVRECCD